VSIPLTPSNYVEAQGPAPDKGFENTGSQDVKDIRIKKLSLPEVLQRQGFEPEALTGLPTHVLEALLAYSVNELIDIKELEQTLLVMGYGLEETNAKA
jgi:hypothetical protein